MTNNCPICAATIHNSMQRPFNKEDPSDTRIVTYYRCANCEYIYCPEMMAWDLGKEVYNEDYHKYDPEYKNSARSKRNLKELERIFTRAEKRGAGIKHLDYGAGNGRLTRMLVKRKWDSTAFDLYSNNVRPTGTFDVITAFEVFEHATDIRFIIKDISSMLNENGIVIFSTLLANRNTPEDWWYIAPRGGHISLLSKKAIDILIAECNLLYVPLDTDSGHVLTSKMDNARKYLELAYGG